MNLRLTYFLTALLNLLLIFPLVSKAQAVIEPAGLEVPVYNFRQIEPFLHPGQNNDTTYIFNFWATFCGPCIKELPYFDQIGEEYKAEKLKIVLVSLDFKSKIESQVIPFLVKRNIKSQVILLSNPDANSWIGKVSESWSGAIPATLIIKGDSREFYGKAFTYDELKLLTIKFLKK